jgi:hypothetical protein
MNADGFHNFLLSFHEEHRHLNFCLLLRNHIINCEYPFSACDSINLFRKPSVILHIIVTKAGHECTVHTRENRPIRENKSQNRNLMRLSEQSLERVFSNKQAETLNLFTSFTSKARNKKIYAHVTENTDLISYALKKYSSVSHSFKPTGAMATEYIQG